MDQAWQALHLQRQFIRLIEPLLLDEAANAALAEVQTNYKKSHLEREG